MTTIPDDIMTAATEAYLSLMDDDRYDDHKYGSEHIARAIMAEREKCGNVVAEIAAERLRQISQEGWTPEHDDEHSCGELAAAAACYAYPAPWGVNPSALKYPPKPWPWNVEWWKPRDRRRNLVRAAALIVAEIERLDRKGGIQP